MDEQYQKILEKIKKLPSRPTKKNNYTRASYWKDNWDASYYLQYVIDTGEQYQKIIAKFLQLKKTPIDNYAQVNFFFNRNLRIAKELEGFSLEKIEKVYKFLEKKMDKYRIALETIGKYLEENIDQLDNAGEDPIIVLKSGEEIYDVNRLIELEKLNKIKYIDNKWIEI